MTLLVAPSITAFTSTRHMDDLAHNHTSCTVVFKSPVLRPEKDRTRTGLLKDCSLGLSNFKTKDRKKTGLYGLVETGLDRSFVRLNYPFKCSPRACQLVEN